MTAKANPTMHKKPIKNRLNVFVKYLLFGFILTTLPSYGVVLAASVVKEKLRKVESPCIISTLGWLPYESLT